MIIPIEAHLITLTVTTYEIVTRQIQVGRETRSQRERKAVVREIPPRRDRANVQQAISAANRLWAPADISFRLATTTDERIAAPADNEVIDENGFVFLAGRFPAQAGLSLLFVNRFHSTHLGGRSIEAQHVCILPFLGDHDSGNVLAHEFGHLLALDHVDDNYNLMYLAYRAGNILTSGQISTALQSRLAKKFGRSS